MPLRGMMRGRDAPQARQDPARQASTPCASSAARGAAGACTFRIRPACGRRPIACARPCSIGCSIRSPARAASICSPDPGRSASRRCRAAPARWCSSSRHSQRRRSLAEELKRFEAGDLAARGGASCEMSAERFLARAGRAFRRDIPRSAVRARRAAGICPAASTPAAGPRAAPGSTSRAPARPARRRCPPHWELVKSKSAGEVGYHLARANVEIHHE